ncbi:MAG: phosphatidate cytidylyltransferase [Paludibacteraceae bacterium]|nr:phosphatidate cytidylyltransferase [Paludibacteraceae bacterium]
MSTIVQRTLSGAVYVAVIVGTVLAPSSLFFLTVIALMTVLGIREFINLTGKDTWLTVMSGLTGICMLLSFWATSYMAHYSTMTMKLEDTVIEWILGISVVVYILSSFAVLLAELYRQAENPMKNWGRYFQSLMMIALPFACMVLLCNACPYYLLALFISVWVNDTGAYLVGMGTARLPHGNHKMFPRVSPKKSWEGLIGGICFNLIAGYVFYRIGWIDRLWTALVFVLLTSVFGTLGDLMESLMKRTVGVKDSGRFMPGHGGVLDRFDSMLLAAPVIVLFALFTT